MRLETLDTMHNYKELKVWEKSRYFVKEIYELSTVFPADEKFGLVSQLKRAAVSISLNIAEGSGRTNKGFVNFLRNAYSSALEVDTILTLAYDLELIDLTQLEYHSEKVNEIQKMIFGLIKNIENKMNH